MKTNSQSKAEEGKRTMNRISESIFSNGDIVIPMADVMFVEKTEYGVMIIMKGTRWDMAADTWSNNAYISNHEGKDKKFMEAWCYYRYEIEGGEKAFKSPSREESNDQN